MMLFFADAVAAAALLPCSADAHDALLRPRSCRRRLITRAIFRLPRLRYAEAAVRRDAEHAQRPMMPRSRCGAAINPIRQDAAAVHLLSSAPVLTLFFILLISARFFLLMPIDVFAPPRYPSCPPIRHAICAARKRRGSVWRAAKEAVVR